MDYSSLLSSDDELDMIENVSIEDESLHLRYYSSGEDENSSKRQRVETTTSDNMTGACGGPEDMPDESMSSVNDSVLECSRVSVSRSSTPSVRMNSRTSTNLASTPCSSRTIIPTFLRTPLSGEVRSSRSPTPVTDISRKDQTTGSENKIDTLTNEVIQMKRQLVKVQENQSNVEKKVDILIQLLHSKTNEPKKGSQKINVPAQIAQSIRDGYQQGITEKDFIWKTKNEAGSILKYNSAENKEMSGFIIEFVKGQYPDEVEGVVREGIKTNFESFKAKKRREETGKQEEHNKKMAVYSRMRRISEKELLRNI
ncbi:uncharacterized protein LOC127722366 [Mytilus californianus]|uniref:uncharacterized protein LOC127722366 n=1 Tax=Mytilus californianus TaxID=6549 RepID=UPI002246380C|nr:uncharacterized protein LOC127722366 [Mytilus californianus]